MRGMVKESELCIQNPGDKSVCVASIIFRLPSLPSIASLLGTMAPSLKDTGIS